MKIGHFVICSLFLAVIIMSSACGETESKQTAKEANNNTAPWMMSTGSGDVLADVNGVKIYMDEYKGRMEKQSPYIRARYGSAEKRKEFLDSMIRFELLAQAAVAKGLDKDPDVIRAAKQVMTQKLMQVEFEEGMDKNDIPEAELRKYYEENSSEYNKPAMRRASHILIKVTEDAKDSAVKKAKQKAEKIYKEALSSKKNPNSFRKLAKKYSDDKATKDHGGDLGYFSKTEEGGQMLKEFSEVAFSMDKINDISKPVRTKMGFHIIRLTGKRDKITRSFEQVKTQIQHRIFKERRKKKFDDFIEDLNKNAKIEINEKLLESYNPIGANKTEKKNSAAEQKKKDPQKNGNKK